MLKYHQTIMEAPKKELSKRINELPRYYQNSCKDYARGFFVYRSYYHKQQVKRK